MPPFFMSLVSASDHWMFISSNGALTAGRKNPDHALFPYYTDDRIHDSKDQTGGKTVAFVTRARKTYLWEPFLQEGPSLYRIKRHLYKNVIGNKLVFEEINLDLSAAFRTTWTNGERFGFIRRSEIVNIGRSPIFVNVLDGIRNLLPHGLNRRFQVEYSTLADGYKKNELDPETGLGIFTLSSIPTDKAEPSESLKATMVWACGLKKAIRLVSARQMDRFRHGFPVRQETDIRAARGAYFVNARFNLDGGEARKWLMAADVDQDASNVAALIRLLKTDRDPGRQVLEDVRQGSENLLRIVAAADGLQKTRDALSSARHFSNVLFNVMRGGIFNDGYRIEKTDFASFLHKTNRTVAENHRFFLEALPESINHAELLSRAAAMDDPDLEKLAYEYLPITFSRRHGDPSRPWNLFSIEIKDGHGGKILNYQGNWRDIFQNWEALALGFPGFIESMVCKFVNASTADGYNPYRLTREGFDWEKLDPHDPWSYIGYWGDHQIIYLLKLLEISSRFHPGKIEGLLNRDIFAYSNVPYRIKPYEDLLCDPRNTVDFEMELEREIERRVKETGSDGKFVRNAQGRTLRVNLAEKLLVPLLAKLSNFIPEAGIWMNTQRPEWNDANNALVGSGVSMVTLCHLRRYLAFCRGLFAESGRMEFSFSAEVADLLESMARVLRDSSALLDGPVSDTDRRSFLDGLGRAGSDYRQKLYSDGLSERRTMVPVSGLIRFFDLALRHADHSIRANRRSDGLYHAYNLMKVEADGSISIRRLYEMLEGQVAVLSSGLLSARQSLEVLDALRASALYRKDQASYILYPDRELPRFVEKNNLPAEAFRKSTLLRKAVESGDRRIVLRDANGGIHFNGDFRNASLLKDALDKMKDDSNRDLVEQETALICAIYENLFDHQSFTGRSGTFYKYEGLGCIYWHMVSKLCLAVQEAVTRAGQNRDAATVRKRLIDHYDEIREGIGVHKTPDAYGAFPTDPYSHTPGFAGVQQPGMTGQVKEDIITRFGELGVAVEDGRLSFRTDLLQKNEFLTAPGTFRYYDLNGDSRTIRLDKGSLAFTTCQIPIIYHLSKSEKILVLKKSGESVEMGGLSLDRDSSASVFERRGDIERLDVDLMPAL
jgi:hypothetical protein